MKLLEKNWKSFFQSIKEWKKHPEKFKNRPKLPSYKHKEKARLMSFVGGKGTSKRIEKLTHKRNQKVNDFMHKTSRLIVDYARTHQIGTIIIGKNDVWKQEINIGKKNNQSFVQIPFNKLIEQIEYKSEEIGITVIQQEESYTSKCSFFDSETVEKHASYVGKRVKRGLFRTGSKRLVNADINGSANIIRKVVPNAFADGIEGVGLRPLKILPLQRFFIKIV